jgi:hypothetical protein
MIEDKLDVMVPEEATDRGPILRGQLSTADVLIPEVLAQFSKIQPQSRKGRIYLYPTVDQARMIRRERSPFAFTGSFVSREGVTEEWTSKEIWLNPTSEIYPHGMLCMTYSSGQLSDLHIKVTNQAKRAEELSKSAWFVMNGCLLLQLLATPQEREIQDAKTYGFERPAYRFNLSDGAIAEIHNRTVSHSLGVDTETKRMGFSIVVEGCKDGETSKKDIDGLLILASLASRERTFCWHWSENRNLDDQHRHWRFGIGRFPKRPDLEEPLILRDAVNFSNFLSKASKKYFSTNNSDLIDTAVYALLGRELPLEVKIVRLLTGVQSVLRFAVPSSKPRSTISELYSDFEKHNSIDLSDLWPLTGKKAEISLSAIRNAAVHGDVFNESDWKALSYAAENLQWTLERILLVSLGWDISLSNVSPAKLQSYFAHQWKEQQQRLDF